MFLKPLAFSKNRSLVGDKSAAGRSPCAFRGRTDKPPPPPLSACGVLFRPFFRRSRMGMAPQPDGLRASRCFRLARSMNSCITPLTPIAMPRCTFSSRNGMSTIFMRDSSGRYKSRSSLVCHKNKSLSGIRKNERQAATPAGTAVSIATSLRRSTELKTLD